MQYFPTPSSSRPADTPHVPTPGGDALAPREVVSLLHLLGILGTLRNDPRHWRQELLHGITQILPAAAAAAFTLKNVQADEPPVVFALFDAGFHSESQRLAFLREFNAAPFADPFSRRMLERFLAQHPDTLTCLRSDLVDPGAWAADAHVRFHRRPTGMGDCLLSLQRGGEHGTVYALLALRTVVCEPAEGGASPGIDMRAAASFTARERLLLDTLHRGLDWLYRAEEAAHRLDHASALRPRLRQTLEYILRGDTERQVAEIMALSIHTVHDYVKSLYLHFGVSSRTELLARWIQSGGQIPPRRE